MKRKENGQYMTPAPVVEMVLDATGYAGPEILDKTVMEPSFGEGAFLLEILRRIIGEGRKLGLSNAEISRCIETNVFGIEKDPALYEPTVSTLRMFLDAEGICANIEKNLICGDTLNEYVHFAHRMDFVVGNPPYVAVHNLTKEYRQTLKWFRFAKGRTDLYVVFYEIGLHMLNSAGTLGYITPNSFIRNASQALFRQHLSEYHLLTKLYDFKDSKIFPDADTYTCICVLDKSKKDTVDYREYSGLDETARSKIPCSYFRDERRNPWNPGSEEDVRFLQEIRKKKVHIGNFANVQNGIATNNDSVFIVHPFEDEDLTIPYMGRHTDKSKVVYFKDMFNCKRKIESSAIRRCVKASTFSWDSTHLAYVVFPYDQNNKPLSESEFKGNFPLAYDYMHSFRHDLLSRTVEKGTEWFQFGRSQGLANANKPKVVFKHVVSPDADTIPAAVLEDDVLVYSGMFVTTDNMNNLLTISETFRSPAFTRFCQLTGRTMGGGYTTVNTKTVMRFGIDREKLIGWD